jgi:hypothetical protein
VSTIAEWLALGEPTSTDILGLGPYGDWVGAATISLYNSCHDETPFWLGGLKINYNETSARFLAFG